MFGGAAGYRDSSTVAKENNPLVGPYPDTEPPIEWQVAGRKYHRHYRNHLVEDV